jgi:hypothetical protein
MSEENYLGEFPMADPNEYSSYKIHDWMLLWIEKYGGIDGEHHKTWVMDQCARIAKGTKVLISVAKWRDGTIDHRFDLDEPSKEYLDWVVEMKAGEDGPHTYDYDEGCPP